jgi:peptidoglycan/xylan/chitin deacetylase (PgdA/CDA1 family)
MQQKGFCLMTNDVEDLALNGKSYNDIGIKVWKEIIPLLLDLYDKYNVKATFFFLAEYAQKFPEIVKLVQPRGHEVACHGFTHDHTQAFDILTLDEQIAHLTKSKKILEDIAGEEVVSFRAPALRVNFDTAKALQITGFKYDSSVAPQRMDIFMSLGSKNKMQWLKAPRTCYEADINNLARSGKSGIYEFPVSSFAMPYIGTLMRVSPTLTALTRYLIYLETKNTTKKSVNFLFHPSEAVAETQEQTAILRREKNPLIHLFAGVLRTKLKLRNNGLEALTLFEKELAFWAKKEYDFLTVKNYANTIQSTN